MFTESDASGGLGSVFPELRQVLTQGLRTWGNAEILKRYGPGVFTDLPTIAADGSIRAAGAPTPPPPASEVFADWLRGNPLVVIVGAVLVVLVVARLARA